MEQYVTIYLPNTSLSGSLDKKTVDGLISWWDGLGYDTHDFYHLGTTYYLSRQHVNAISVQDAKIKEKE
jgi:hypothetical protein